MRPQDNNLYSYIDNPRLLSKMSEKSCVLYMSHHARELFKTLFIAHKLKEKTKLFYITDTTSKRTSIIDATKPTGEMLKCLSEKAGETGFIYFNNGAHCLYAITKTAVTILASGAKFKGHYDSDFEFKNKTSGFIYFNYESESPQFWINSSLDAIFNKEDSFALKDKQYVSELIKLNKEFKSLGYTEIDSVKKYDDCPYYNELKKLYDYHYKNTLQCFQAFLFIRFAKILDTTHISSENTGLSFKERVYGVKKSLLNIIKVDTLYDETLHVINPFSVSGHFRNQPIGEGRVNRKTIYIDSFMKEGYNRVATKIAEGITPLNKIN